MPKINLLDKSVFELIAAGEVIERPASVIKELAENSIDAGARTITVEIRHGGISYIRVTDDGCGISHEDIPLAFMRHATSKVYTADDLDSINTLGFRGEALASVSAVSRIELFTKQADSAIGSSYRIEGGEPAEYDRTGCADGTTIIIRDLFYNTPARLKFLKKEVTEGNYCSSVIEKLALSHPHISFRFIRDGKQTLLTAGDGEYYSAIYAVFGKQFAASVIPVEYVYRDTGVTGYISAPLFSRGNRTMQHFFVNGRSVRSPLCCAALEEGFRNSIMVGKFPACVLCVNTDPSKIDANIHPTKTEVRFTEEKTVFDAVLFGVKNALLSYDESREIKLPNTSPEAQEKTEPMPEPKSETVSIPTAASTTIVYPTGKTEPQKFSLHQTKPFQTHVEKPAAEQLVLPEENGYSFITERSFEKRAQPENPPAAQPQITEIAEPVQPAEIIEPAKPERIPMPVQSAPYQPESQAEKHIGVRVIGEIFRTYILCETDDTLMIIDKHAAHERVNFERLKNGLDSAAQYISPPAEVLLSPEEYNAVGDFTDKLSEIGLLVELCEGCKARVTALPALLDSADAAEILESAARILVSGNTNAEGELLDDILHTMACKASIRGNEYNDIRELAALADEVVNNHDIRFCPHGRPVVTQITRKQIEKYFGRIV
ncbi:MAG: DNA mismatch repair endonuclease MutL [Oscillospiraceae bacterium]